MGRPSVVAVVRSVDEAREALSAERGATVIGGGTWLVPSWHDLLGPAHTVLTLRRVPGATTVRRGGCGAAVTARQLATGEVPCVLREAAAAITRPAVMNAVTVGGNVVAPGPRFIALALLALRAGGRVWDGGSAVWTGIDALVEAPPRLVTAFRWTRPAGSAFAVLRDRPTGGEVLGSAAAAWAGPGREARLRLAVGAGPSMRPRLCTAAMSAWAGQVDRSLQGAAGAALAALDEDLSDRPAHARAVARALVQRSLAAALERGMR
jgi:CO/xanthine dehydrogenase FAD-binding subunit